VVLGAADVIGGRVRTNFTPEGFVLHTSVPLDELSAGRMLLDPAAAAWEHIRELILSFVRP
jgi:hypothetical protein